MIVVGDGQAMGCARDQSRDLPVTAGPEGGVLERAGGSKTVVGSLFLEDASE